MAKKSNNSEEIKEPKQKKGKAPKIEEPEYVSEAIAKKVRNKERTQKVSKIMLVLLLLSFIVTGIIWGSLELLNYNSHSGFMFKLGDVAAGQGIGVYKDIVNEIKLDKEELNSAKQAPLRDSRLEDIDFDDISTEYLDAEGNVKHSDYNSYSLYIRNDGSISTDINVFLEMPVETQHVADAARIRLIVRKVSADGSIGVDAILDNCYARLNQDGESDTVVSDPSQYTGAENQELARTSTVPFYDDAKGADVTTIVNETLGVDLQPGESLLFSVFVWFDGTDPECTDAILGGSFSLSMTIDVAKNETAA